MNGGGGGGGGGDGDVAADDHFYDDADDDDFDDDFDDEDERATPFDRSRLGAEADHDKDDANDAVEAGLAPARRTVIKSEGGFVGGGGAALFSASASERRLIEDAFKHGVVDGGGAGMDAAAGGVGGFHGGDGFGPMEMDCGAAAEGGVGGGTKMYTPAQKKAIVEYAVQYGERAAAKKFGVHRKNIYRCARLERTGSRGSHKG